ncbi:NAD(P)-binding protein [Qipengyuania xiapuensis]|uniref:NAD(P)-binding protein n=1 Tax=Qipengyuania xiapuensis TaxID=2867236 RepID=A0ABX8ZX87_9SPHN|nr:FAD-dependent oxidoreductase [Qipengyuania xiapuensis]QZD93615.1 NAD(P)-binding protein [Qipengyuania xiapuensis]
MKTAIVGAGMAGLSCATALRDAGDEVALFDKGRGPGGRMSTRRMDADGETLRFDHGAQYFTVRDERFRTQVANWQERGIAERWPAAGEDAWVGTPGMNAPIRAMADELGVQFGARIERIERDGQCWLIAGEGFDPAAFDRLVLALPAEQAAPLLEAHCPEWSKLAATTISDPCWTVMAAFADAVPHFNDTLRNAGPIGWAARDSAKPRRSAGERWVIQAGPEWSRAHLEDEREEVTEALLGAFAAEIGAELPEIVASSAHRWRYAKSGSAGEAYLWDANLQLGVCGDWLVAPRVEGGWVSGRELAEAVLASSG